MRVMGQRIGVGIKNAAQEVQNFAQRTNSLKIRMDQMEASDFMRQQGILRRSQKAGKKWKNVKYYRKSS